MIYSESLEIGLKILGSTILLIASIWIYKVCKADLTKLLSNNNHPEFIINQNGLQLYDNETSFIPFKDIEKLGAYHIFDRQSFFFKGHLVGDNTNLIPNSSINFRIVFILDKKSKLKENRNQIKNVHTTDYKNNKLLKIDLSMSELNGFETFNIIKEHLNTYRNNSVKIKETA